MNSAVTYAAKTKVTVERSERELRTMLTARGIKKFAFETDTENGQARVFFKVEKIEARIAMKLPRLDSFIDKRIGRRTIAAEEQHEQACRTR